MAPSYIGISFTLKNQPFEEIKKALESISMFLGAKSGKVVLVHGFMPKDVVKDKGFSTEVVDTLKELFPLQINCYSDKPEREMMAALIKENAGTVYAIGSIIDGVAEEVALYEERNVMVSKVPAAEINNWASRPLTYGEKAVGLTFNPGGMSEVNAIKVASAAVIDELNNQRDKAKLENNGEKIAQFTLAIRDIQSGQMWGVKAATWQF